MKFQFENKTNNSLGLINVCIINEMYIILYKKASLRQELNLGTLISWIGALPIELPQVYFITKEKLFYE